MHKICFEDPPGLKEPQKWSKEFNSFLQSCLVKDQKLRKSAEQILEAHKDFFAKAKDEKYLKDTLLNKIVSVQERVRFNNKNSMESILTSFLFQKRRNRI